MSSSRSFHALALLPLAASLSLAQAQNNNNDATVVVTGSVRAQAALDAPFAIHSVDAQTLRDAGPMVNLSESLARVPGLLVANRNNYAQDLQISSRGFGARATFGVRGIRLYTDGIPASGPDGQGQVAHFDLAGAQRVEVLRGPFSVLYGNSSGGVIALFSAPVRQGQFEVAGDLGRFGMTQMRTSIAAPLGGGFDLKLGLSSLALAGFRPQSEATRDLVNLRLGFTGTADKVVLLFNHHSQDALDPLGLDLTSYRNNPLGTLAIAQPQSASNPTGFNTRKTIAQTQTGVNWRHSFNSESGLQETSLSAYTGMRSVTQFLAIPVATQNAVRHGGGVVDFDRRYEGLEAKANFGWGALNLVTGLTLDRQRDARRGFENFVGAALGVQGRLRRDEDNTATTRDAFVQAEYALSSALTATAGVRSGSTEVKVSDHYTAGAPPNNNGDDSGQLKFSYTNPVLGLRWKLGPQWTLHASAARGYESPTLGELAYTFDNHGFNFGLQGQTSRQFEVGSKWRSGALDLDATLFRVNTSNEIAAITNTGGRSSFDNVGRTQRHGLELAAAWRPLPSLRLAASASTLLARYRDTFKTCPGTPCTITPNDTRVSVPVGNLIAGTQRRSAWAEVAWKPGAVPGEFALEARGQSATFASDLNDARSRAPGFGVLNARWSNDWPLGEAGTVQTLVRVENLAQRQYIGSVIVNEANQRYFEPGSPRSLMLSVRWKKDF
ncbi:outer membrane receptor protein [Burkholderiales bacterium JOSHI_001]|nr:outer membrane receptor protein [Burkholderiales bacterium JOSHI_001]